MNIDRIAGAMTGGRPRAGFTARVMAPIYGRPRPGFTVRVMNGLDAPGAGRGFSRGAHRAAFLLVPAAIALVAGLMAIRASRVDSPAPPAAPQFATAPAFRTAIEAAPQAPRVAQAFKPGTRQAPTPVPPEQAPPGPPPIYMIAALERPDDITMKAIEPAAFTIPALDAPAPLKVPDLKSSKEKP